MKKLVAIVEIPYKSNIKYEYDYKTNTILVDRILREGFVYPVNYGCLIEALDWDGDPLDVLIYSECQFIPGSRVNIRVIGAMRMIDDGETDTKLIAVHDDDYRLDNIKHLNDLPTNFLKKVKTFFETYKNWKRPNITQVPGFEDEIWAEKEYEECVQLKHRYSTMDKQEFIKKMKIQHPEKYVID